MQATDQSIGEEIANSVSHGVGAPLAIAELVLLTIRAAGAGGCQAHHLLCGLRCFGDPALSQLHSLPLAHGYTRAHRVMRSLDHDSIYRLIAGTYSPFTLIGLRGALGWTLFGVDWTCALMAWSLSH